MMPEIFYRKITTKIGFNKHSFAPFNRDVLSYIKFKNRWTNEVAPEKNPTKQLAALRELVPDNARAKITNATTMSEA